MIAQDTAMHKTIAPEERQALIALYNAIGGPHWKDNSGWLAAPGTECGWHGVECSFPGHIGEAVPFVSSLDLAENNLAGAIPAELGGLKNLERLYLFGNRLTGVLPELLIQRWLAGPLWISAEAPLLTNVSKIDYEWTASALLCAQRRILLDAKGTAVVYTVRCRNARPGDRAVYCEVKEGKLSGGAFATLAWAIERAGFFNLQSQYDRNVTDAAFARTRVVRAEKTTEVSDYADSGPLELWSVERTIEGVASDMLEGGAPEVKSSRQAACPKW